MQKVSKRIVIQKGKYLFCLMKNSVIFVVLNINENLKTNLNLDHISRQSFG
jgi:hypothetical protein